LKWIEPPEKGSALKELEDSLWKAADQFRANSNLTAAQYSQPVLGLIFLRFADTRFMAQRAKVEKAASSGRRAAPAIDDPRAYQAVGILYLNKKARFEYLLSLPETAALGEAINDAMRLIEKDNQNLKGVLPQTYQVFEARTLVELLKLIASIPLDLEGDVFGKIYEYFLGAFAMAEGQLGGEFFTPTSIVRLMVEILEPFHGKILDPACGSGGMFVQSARFVAEHKKNPSDEISIHGQERVQATTQLCRMNLAVNGLEGDIRFGNSYYDDLHQSVGKFDFALANPPFNVNGIQKDRLVDEVSPKGRFPFGLPNTDNGNYLWIQTFYSALNEKGRAGFVMANSASDARGSEQEIRRKLIESGAVDVIIAVGTNMFYTVTLPVTLWFLDKRKSTKSNANTILFLDVRNIFRQLDRATRDWTPSHIGFIANVVRLYRGENSDNMFGSDEVRAKVKNVFSDSTYRDVLGLCKVATLKEVEAQGWSLNPGRYVGVAPGETVSDETFKGQLEALNVELDALNTEARDLEHTIATNVAEILGGRRWQATGK
jgi:type I restriction enzyme M protein